ncbi:MAG: ABC transporter permease [Candidatus Melainabacteria bacterium]|nr:ABC transporter permease [Candidatus Melainabacteria bacterium]
MYWIALKMLFGDRVKFVTLLVGLSFSVLLITQQGSIFCGLMKRTSATIFNTGAPVWVSDARIRSVDDVKPLQDTDLPRVRSVTGVQYALPLLFRITQAQLPSGDSENILLVGVDEQALIGIPQAVRQGNLSRLNQPEAVAVDDSSLEKLGNPGLNSTFEINDKRARITAIVGAKRSFFAYPYVYTTFSRALEYMPRQRKLMSFVLAYPKPGISAERLALQIERETGLGAFTEEEFLWHTIGYYMKNTGIPINFGITIFLGLLVGAAISAQTFYAFVMENMRQFGTFKAIGVGNGTLIRMIFLQSSTVSIMGYGIGVGLLALFASRIPPNGVVAFYTPWQLLAIAFVFIVVISVFASLVAGWRVLRIEPAIVFRG